LDELKKSLAELLTIFQNKINLDSSVPVIAELSSRSEDVSQASIPVSEEEKVQSQNPEQQSQSASRTLLRGPGLPFGLPYTRENEADQTQAAPRQDSFSLCSESSERSGQVDLTTVQSRSPAPHSDSETLRELTSFTQAR